MLISDWSSDVCSSDLEFASCPIDQPAQAIQRAWAGCCEAQPVPFDDEITALRCRFRHALITRWRCIPYSSVVETKQLIAQAHACASSFPVHIRGRQGLPRSEEHTSELQSLMRISYAVFCLKKKQNTKH